MAEEKLYTWGEIAEQGEIATVKHDGHVWRFYQPDAELQGGVKEPLLGYGFAEPRGFYWAVDGNRRVWLQMDESEIFFSPCLRFCLYTIRQHPQSFERVWELLGWEKNEMPS